MLNSKFSKTLTAFLIIIGVAIIATLGYIVYDTITIKSTEEKAEEKVEEFVEKKKVVVKKKEENKTETENENIVVDWSLYEDASSNNLSEQTETNNEDDDKVYMEGYEVMGTIEIPATGIKYPILEKVTKKSLETAVAILYPEGATLNQPGNVTILGHNYRNGLFFSNNKKLKKNDVIYITDAEGNRIVYAIYDIFYTTPDDASYMTRDTQGAREISLSTCNDDSSQRLIILAKEK